MTARGGLLVQPQFHLSNHPSVDVLLIPGGVVASQMEHAPAVEWIRAASAGSILTASACTGAFLLGKSGRLRGKRATTHWEDLADMEAMFPDTLVEPHSLRIDSGRFIPSAGISASLDMSLYIVAKLVGPELATLTARLMEEPFQWPDA